MTKKQYENLKHLERALTNLGINTEDQEKLRRIEMTLHRWSEHECNGNIQRDGENGDGAPRWYYGDMDRAHSYAIADRERGALRRLAVIMKNYSHLWYYVQSDPRGCSLYVGPWKDYKRGGVNGTWEGRQMIEGDYTRGVAVCL